MTAGALSVTLLLPGVAWAAPGAATCSQKTACQAGKGKSKNCAKIIHQSSIFIFS
jgi:hypothetical protein